MVGGGQRSGVWQKAVLVATGMWAAACNTLTGSSGYEEVPRCTGTMCGVCPAGQRWYPVSEICVAECSVNAIPCGLACCGQMQSCVTEAGGVQRCSMCEKAEYECGKTCCEQGETCLDSVIGACGSSYGVTKQSCKGGLDCGGGTSCCESVALPGGTFPQGSPESDPDALVEEEPERAVTVSPFSLDKYEVTVGRFRKFVEGWDYKPLPAGAGAYSKIAESGWRSSWNERLPKKPADWESSLTCDNFSTWALSKGSKDSLLPINCVNWYQAFAFCAWDGGRLPTEAEWEYAAAGGDENRKFPWGAKTPSDELVVFDCRFGGTPGECYENDVSAPVGSKSLGAGRWGHFDLAGGMFEWVLDVYDEYPPVARKDYAKTENVSIRVLRGGSWNSDESSLRAASRHTFDISSDLDNNIGLRCARGQQAE